MQIHNSSGPFLAIVWKDALRQLLALLDNETAFVKHESGDSGQDYLQVINIMSIDQPLSGARYSNAMFSVALPLDVKGYVAEVTDGAKNHLVDMNDRNKWHYTYDLRLREYGILNENGFCIDQIGDAIQYLEDKPTSRRIQAITWQPWVDRHETSPPCLQRLWFQVIDGKLEMHSHWRSRDGFLAAYMNMIALTKLQEKIAHQVGVEVGSYVDISDSYHIYRRDIKSIFSMFALLDPGGYLTKSKFQELCGVQEEAFANG